MIIAADSTISRITTNEGHFLAAINQAVVDTSKRQVPCYAIAGKRSVRWVSVGSSAVISRSIARDFLARVGVDIDVVEAV